MPEVNVNQIRVKAPARLHMGFMDMHGGLGRSFGSLGLCLENLYTSLSVRESGSLHVSGPGCERAQRYAGQILEHFAPGEAVEIQIERAIPEHMGLGSGTQLSLALGLAITQLKGIRVSIEDIACCLGRGARSGIGIGAFRYGGFIVDGGRGESTRVPPVISRMGFPDEWRILLLLDHSRQGVHGKEEVQAFRSLPEMQDNTVNHLCRIVVMQVLPALAEKNCEAFGAGITEIQNCVGDHFQHVQGGRYASARVASVLEWAGQQDGVTGIGQSSWGPTGFAILPSETQAYQTMKKAREIFSEDDQIEFILARARNQMAEMYLEESKLKNRVNIRNF
ncbi:MAG: GHMP kinase [Gammaproteobacteria bacterium]|nr:GHMP kinase [Gammaproteobacteria bacterium]